METRRASSGVMRPDERRISVLEQADRQTSILVSDTALPQSVQQPTDVISKSVGLRQCARCNAERRP